MSPRSHSLPGAPLPCRTGSHQNPPRLQPGPPVPAPCHLLTASRPSLQPTQRSSHHLRGSSLPRLWGGTSCPRPVSRPAHAPRTSLRPESVPPENGPAMTLAPRRARPPVGPRADRGLTASTLASLVVPPAPEGPGNQRAGGTGRPSKTLGSSMPVPPMDASVCHQKDTCSAGHQGTQADPPQSPDASDAQCRPQPQEGPQEGPCGPSQNSLPRKPRAGFSPREMQRNLLVSLKAQSEPGSPAV